MAVLETEERKERTNERRKEREREAEKGRKRSRRERGEPLRCCVCAPSCSLIYKASSLARYIRLGSGAKRGIERRERIGKKSERGKDFIFGSPMTCTSSRERRGARLDALEGREDKDDVKEEEREEPEEEKKKKKRASPNTI